MVTHFYMNKLLLIVASVLFSGSCFSQAIQDAFDRYQKSVEIEKVYVSLDKSYYKTFASIITDQKK